MSQELDNLLAKERPWWVEQGDVIAVLKKLPDQCVDVLVTSPPYFGLRAYKAGPTEIGQEKTPEQYISRLVDVFHEARRVLKDHATVWLNLGDNYWGSWGNYAGGTRGKGAQRPRDKGSRALNDAYDGRELDRPQSSHRHKIYKQGDLCGVPFRVALALQADGWYLRSDNIWIKRACMPQSQQGWRWERCRVKINRSDRGREKWAAEACASPQGDHRLGEIDGSATWTDCPGCKKCKPHGGYILRKGSWRTTTAHEYIFMLAKSEKYYADGFAVRQQLAQATLIRDRYTRVLDDPNEQYAVQHNHETVSDPEQGANLRSFFVFKGESFPGKHYAVFPSELPGLAIKCGTSDKGVCSKCGMPYVRVLQKKLGIEQALRIENRKAKPKGDDGRCTVPTQDYVEEYQTLEWRPSCVCKKPRHVPALVLDIFSGSGTTGIACQRTNRRYLGIELNEEYAADSRHRLATRGHGVARPQPRKEKGGFNLP